MTDEAYEELLAREREEEADRFNQSFLMRMSIREAQKEAEERAAAEAAAEAAKPSPFLPVISVQNWQPDLTEFDQMWRNTNHA